MNIVDIGAKIAGISTVCMINNAGAPKYNGCFFPVCRGIAVVNRTAAGVFTR
jgi:hypothetical protein